MNTESRNTDYQTVPPNHWQAYFDLLSKMAQGRHMRLEVIGRSLGDQIEKEWNLFEGLSYDRQKDILYLHTRDLEHSIAKPRDVIAQEEGLVRSLSIRDSDGLIQIVHFRDPFLLKGT